MKIDQIIFANAQGAFFYDDQQAIRAGRAMDGPRYLGEPLTPGFTAVRQPADALSIGLVLSDGMIAWGDMVSVQYSGAGGRDPLFDRTRIERQCTELVNPRLIGLAAVDAVENCAVALASVDGRRLPLALEYGVSQALLQAAAYTRRLTIAELTAEMLGLSPPTRAIPIFAQSGDERHANVDKMIMKRVGVLPHGLINSAEKFGPGGSVFIDYVDWVARRAADLGGAGYRPWLHFDLYGWIGLGIGTEPAKIAEFIARVAERVPDHILHIECPADYGSRQAQIDNYAAIVEHVDALCANARVVADEQCNTLDDIEAFVAARAAHIVQIKTPDVGNLLDSARAIVRARAAGIGAYCGGTSAETDQSARACVHVALGAQADFMLAKPGMGVDEAICIVGNEQNRALAAIRHRLGG